MGFTSQTVNIPTDLYTIDASGAWVVRPVDEAGQKVLFQFDFYVSASVQAIKTTYAKNTFAEIMAEMKLQNVKLGQADFEINVERSADTTPAINDQFSATLLTNQQLDQIALDFDPVRLCATIANIRLIRRMNARSLITFPEILSIFAYLGSKDKVSRNSVIGFGTNEVGANRLTQAQADQLLAAYDAAIGQRLTLPKR